MKMKITGNGNTQVYLKQLTVIDKIFEAIGQQEVNEINLSEYSEKQLIRARRKLTRERLKILLVAMTQRDMTRLFIGYIIFMICLQLSGSTFSLTDSSAIWFFISVTAIFLFFMFKIYCYKNKHMFENTLGFCYTNHRNFCVLFFVKARCLAV